MMGGAGSPRVLVCDDDAAVADVLTLALEDVGYEAVTVGTPADALGG
jgi:CheY-like chemotaxis protein